jgi:hypothetical protein
MSEITASTSCEAYGQHGRGLIISVSNALAGVAEVTLTASL